MKKIDLYLAQPISIMGANGTSYENVTHIDTTKDGGEYIEDKEGEILFFNEMDAEMQLNTQQAIYEATKPDMRAVVFSSFNFRRRMLSRMTDLEKYIIWKEEDEVTCYTLDEFSADFNDECISTQDWVYFIDFNECERKLAQKNTKVTLYKVWADSESDYEIEDDEQVIFNNLDEAHNAASAWAHEYDSEHGRAIFHIDDMMTGETIDTVESIPGE
jgi:hypothetical protein